MKIKKLTAAAMAAAMLAAAAPICGTASADTQTEYGCEWVDVRPDSKYKLSVEKVNADGKEQCVVTLSGIPINTIESALGEDMVIEADGMRGTRKFEGVKAVIDINNGSQFIYMGYYEDNNGETKSYAVLDDIRPVIKHKDKTPCYTGSYRHGLLYSGMYESSISYPAEIKRVNDELCFVFTTAVDDISAQYLMNAKTTTVMTYAAIYYSASPINGGIGGASGGSGSKIGFLSDGTLIKGDGKYIDCGTNQEVQEGLGSVRLAAEVVDSITDLPKETVSITVVDDSDNSDTSTPSDSTKEQSFHDDTTDISVEGNFPEGTQLKTEIKQVSDTKVSWDITLLDASGNKVQPNGMATVKLPLPESFKGYKVYVYRIDDDGTHTRLESTVEGDYIVFKAAHFTEYMLSTEDLDDTSEPATVIPGDTDSAITPSGSDSANGSGDGSASGSGNGSASGSDQQPTGIALALAPVVLAASAAVVVLSKKKK